MTNNNINLAAFKRWDTSKEKKVGEDVLNIMQLVMMALESRKTIWEFNSSMQSVPTLARLHTLNWDFEERKFQRIFKCKRK